MRQKPVAAICSSLLVGLVGAAGLVGGAHAAIYGGAFDPVGDSYSFSGTHVFSVDDACLTNTGTVYVNQYEGGCGKAALLSGSLTVIDNTTEKQHTFNFSDFGITPQTPYTNISDIFVTYDYTTGRNTLSGVDTGLVGPFFDSDFDSNYFWLQWYFVGGDPVDLSTSPCSTCSTSFVGTAFNVSFNLQTVPEPASLSLAMAALAAMGGVGFGARRRRTARMPAD